MKRNVAFVMEAWVNGFLATSIWRHLSLAVSQIDPAPHAVQRSDSLAKGWHHIIALHGHPPQLFGAPLRDRYPKAVLEQKFIRAE